MTKLETSNSDFATFLQSFYADALHFHEHLENVSLPAWSLELMETKF